MKTITAKQTFWHTPKILRASKKRILFGRKDRVLITNKKRVFDFAYGAVIDESIVSSDDLNHFSENDIVELKDNQIYFLWECENDDNVFFLTESCPHKCIMCPQPPSKHDKALESKNMQILKLIPKHYSKSICLTGGEPTILKDYYLNLLAKIRQKFKHNVLITLTGGTQFSNLNFLNKFVALKSDSIVAISFPSDIDTMSDFIVGKNGSFYQTHNGIYNLAKANEKIELRIVVSKLNYKRLPFMADYIYKNYPFVYHIAIMGLEFIGYAESNYNQIYINPKEYDEFLQECVKKLARYDMNVSIYNIPLCLLDKSIRKYAVKSISKWKNAYHKICSQCDEKEFCCGVFTTSKYQYQNIEPIVMATTGERS